MFLQDIVTLAKSKGLAAEAFKHLLYRKLQTSARALYDSHLDLHGVKYADISMLEALQLAEFLFMKTANPRAAQVSLARVPKMANHDKNFYKIQAHISRLAKISVLDEIEAVREVLYQTRCLSTFTASITVTDRAALEAANTERVAANLQPFNMAGAIQHLLQKYQDANCDTAAPVPHNPLESSFSTMRVAPTNEMVSYDHPMVAWIPRGGTRGRGGRGGPPGRGGFSPYGQAPGPQQGPAQPWRPGHAHQGHAPYRPPPPHRGNGQARYAVPNFPPTFDTTPPGAWKKPKELVLDHKQLNIPFNSCWGCGGSHPYTSRQCQFFGTPLFSNACRWCHIGGHSHKLCPRAQDGANPIQQTGGAGGALGAPGGPRRGQARRGRNGPQVRLAQTEGEECQPPEYSNQDRNIYTDPMGQFPDPFDWMLSEQKN